MRLAICGLMIASLALATAVRGDDVEFGCPAGKACDKIFRACKTCDKSGSCKPCKKAATCKPCDKTACCEDREESVVCVTDCSACEEVACSNDTKACCSAKCDKAGCARCSTALAENIAHLEKAVEHLEQAGMEEEAESVAERLNDLRCALLKHKIAEVEQLKAQVQQLRQASNRHAGHAWNANYELDPPKPHPQAECPEVGCRQDAHAYPGGPQVLFKVQVAEVSLTALEKLGFGLECLSGGCAAFRLPDAAQAKCDGKCPKSETCAFQMVDATAITGLINALQRENIVKILAEPTLVTVSGRPSSYIVGDRVAFPVTRPDDPIRYREVGTRIDAVPVLLGNNKIRLQLHARISELDPALDTIAGNQKIPGIRAREVDTSMEMKLGQTVALSGLAQERLTKVTGEDGKESLTRSEVALLVLIRPELVEAIDPLQAPTARAPSRTEAK